MHNGDFVTRLSHNHDILFQIEKIEKDIAYLKGVYLRIIADAHVDDLEIADDVFLRNEEDKIEMLENKVITHVHKNKGFITGKILHIDGDEFYLNKCLNLYKKVGIYAVGFFFPERDFKKHIINLIEKYAPDIVIITGHDSYDNRNIHNLDSYTNTKSFRETVLEIRKRYGRDHIFIYAGACQSNFEAIIASGANFASSPSRVNIHAFDPAIVGIIAAISSFSEQIKISDIVYFSESGLQGIGGIESYGKMRLLL